MSRPGPPVAAEPFGLAKRLADWNQARLDERVSKEIQELAKRGDVTLAEWLEIRCNSWEREHLYPALTDEALAHAIEHNLKNCFRRSVPSATYEDALSQHLAPLMLARWKRTIRPDDAPPATQHEEGCCCELFSDCHKDIHGFRPRGAWSCSRVKAWHAEHYVEIAPNHFAPRVPFETETAPTTPAARGIEAREAECAQGAKGRSE